MSSFHIIMICDALSPALLTGPPVIGRRSEAAQSAPKKIAISEYGAFTVILGAAAIGLLVTRHRIERLGPMNPAR